MRRPLIVLVLGINFAFGGIAQAQLPPPNGPLCGDSVGGTAVDCFGAGNGTAPGSAGGGTATGAAVVYVPYPRLSQRPDGQQCVEIGYYPQGGPVPDDRAPSEVPSPDRIPGAGGFNNLYEDYPPCPPVEGQPAAQDTPAQFAARFWERVPLPVPRPYIAPGWAITGKLAYLETRGETTKVYRADTPFGPLEINATGTYVVDWGDGEQSGPHSFEGKAWPEGEITHDYVWARTYDIAVTERWVARWSLGGQSGILRQLATRGSIDDFPARQIQAVIR